MFTCIGSLLPDAAIYYQFSRYLEGKGIHLEDILSNSDELKLQGGEFLNDVYPGMERSPNELIRLMTSEDADKSMNSIAVLNPEDGQACTPPSNSSSNRKKRASGGDCPQGWHKNLHGSCLYYEVTLNISSKTFHMSYALFITSAMAFTGKAKFGKVQPWRCT